LKKILFVHKVQSGNFGNADAQYMPMTLTQLGYDVTVACLAGGDPSLLQNAGVRVVELAGGNAWFTGLAEMAREIRPDVVHVFIHAGCGIYPLIMRTSPKARFILDIRSPSLRTNWTRYAAQIKNRLEPLLYDAITAHSVESAWTLISKRHTVHLVPPGIELACIPTYGKSINGPDPLRLIYIGSLRGLRKVPVMIDAVLIAMESAPLQLDIYGDGEDLGTIESMIRQHHAEERIHLQSIIPRNDLLQRLGLYDIGLSYVPKALYDHAPPLKTIEYLASGISVVATDTKANELLIDDEENGILAGEEPQAFAAGILRAANNPELRRKFAETARPSVVQYDWKYIVETQLLPVYEGVV
jgi:glycosyltransferase involved in cell wall biosynthesis